MEGGALALDGGADFGVAAFQQGAEIAVAHFPAAAVMLFLGQAVEGAILGVG